MLNKLNQKVEGTFNPKEINVRILIVKDFSLWMRKTIKIMIDLLEKEKSITLITQQVRKINVHRELILTRKKIQCYHAVQVKNRKSSALLIDVFIFSSFLLYSLFSLEIVIKQSKLFRKSTINTTISKGNSSSK